MNGFLESFNLFVGYGLIAAFLCARGVLEVAMVRGKHDLVATYLAWIFCSPLLAVALFFLVNSRPP